MNNNIEVVVKLCDEDRARLDAIIAALEKGNKPFFVSPPQPLSLEGRKVVMAGPENEGKEPQKEESRATTQAKPEAAPVAEIEPQEAKEKAPAKPEPQQAPDVSLEQLQGLVVKLATNGKKLEARELVFKYATSVTAVPADKRGELYAELQKLEG